MSGAYRTLLLVVVLVLAGCSSGPPVAADEAKERALAAEGEYIGTQLDDASCVESSGGPAVGLVENATVRNTTDSAVYVDVTHPYSYSTGGLYAHGSSEATYRVTPDDTERIRGTSVGPC